MRHRPWLSLDWLGYRVRTRGPASCAYTADIAACFGQDILSPWENLRGGLVLGGEEPWTKVKRLLAGRGGEEELRWRRRIGRDATARAIDALARQQEDERVGIWLRVRFGGERTMALARRLGYASGIRRVVERVEDRSRQDRSLRRRLDELRAKVKEECELREVASV